MTQNTNTAPAKQSLPRQTGRFSQINKKDFLSSQMFCCLYVQPDKISLVSVLSLSNTTNFPLSRRGSVSRLNTFPLFHLLLKCSNLYTSYLFIIYFISTLLKQTTCHNNITVYFDDISVVSIICLCISKLIRS